jgi:hypothetical protein
MKTINVEDSTWRNLNTMKYALCCDSLDSLINKLILSYSINKKEVKLGVPIITPKKNENNKKEVKLGVPIITPKKNENK